MSEKLDKLYNELSGLTVLEVAELVKLLEDKWGVSAAAAMPAFAMASGPARLLPPRSRRRRSSTSFSPTLARRRSTSLRKSARSPALA